ncbi:hypothetical protein BASA82_000526 [Batrachochytrium salamandrivorans]|nr:hypothetical protein BASA82_000526 [Batrachochytrium salamandrivorans]
MVRCEGESLLQGVQYLYWGGVTCSAGLVLVWPTARSWHRYGKLRTTTTASADVFLSELTVPKQWFFWFYVVGLVWTLVLLGSGGRAVWWLAEELVCGNPLRLEVASFTPVPLAVYALHLGRRLVEEWYSPPSQAKMHLFGFAVGGTFYLFAPVALTMASMAVDPNVKLVFHPIHVLTGIFLLYKGTVHQYICHGILRTRAAASTGTAATTSGAGHYTFPRGDWFRWTSNPHYLAEILIYLGLYCVLPSGGAYSQRFWVLVVAFTAFNLCITGAKTHQWYLHRFGKPYEQEQRYRVLPLIF